MGCEKDADITFCSQKESSAHHLVNGGNLAGLVGGDTGHLFLIFGKAGDTGKLFIR